MLLQQAIEENERMRQFEDKVGAKWDAQFGHCFHDLPSFLCPFPQCTLQGPSLDMLLQQATEENERMRQLEDRVGAKWDAQFGHCFPDLLGGLPT